MPIERKRMPRAQVAEMIRANIANWNAVVADCNDLLAEYQEREMDEPGTQYEQVAQKARAVRDMAQVIQQKQQRLLAGMVREESLLANLNQPKAESEPAT